MKKRIRHQFVIIALLLLPTCVLAKDKAKDLPPTTEQTTKLDPLEVKTNPFADWGISTLAQGSLLMYLGTSPNVIWVAAVDVGSPAHKAGVQPCDKILSLGGVPVSEMSFRDYEKRFHGTERGEIMRFKLENPVTKAQRIVEIDVKSNKSWIREDGLSALDFWGVNVVRSKSEKINIWISPVTERITGWRTVEVQSRKKKKDPAEPVKTKKVPIRISRRTVVLTWAKKSLVLIERENRVVEIIEADKVLESDDVVGRLVGEGSTLTLKADGSYELDVVVPKDEPVNTPPAESQTLAEAEAGDTTRVMRGSDGHTPAVAAWNRSVEPFCIAGNLYYVGASGVASYLIATPDGHILIDSGFAETVTHIEANMKRLGFRLEDIRVLLVSHGHYDHAGGMAELKKRTNARLLVNPDERTLLMRGGGGDFAFKDQYRYAPVTPDGELRDGEVVKLGGAEITAHFTPGHTKGCTSWTTTVRVNDREYRIVIVASMTAPGYQVVGNAEYPTITDDYRSSFAKLRALPCDIFLSLHGWDFGLDNKIAARSKNPEVNPFVDPEGYRRFLEKSEANLKKQVGKQSALQSAP